MTTYKIEKNVPIPNPSRGGGGLRKDLSTNPMYNTLNQLEINDSFYIDNIHKAGIAKVRGLLGRWRKQKYVTGNYVTRTIGSKGIRIWRVE